MLPGHPSQTHPIQHQALPASVQNLGHRRAVKHEGNEYTEEQNGRCRPDKLRFEATSRQTPLLKHTQVASSTAGYGHGVTSWLGAETTTSPTPVKISEGLNGEAAWRPFTPHEPPTNHNFPPYAAHQPQTTAGWPSAPLGAPTVGNGEPTSRPEDGWPSFPQPVRSLSYSGEHTGQYLSSRSPYERKSSAAPALYPSPIATSIDTMTSAPGGAMMGPQSSLSAGALPSTTHYAWQHPYQYAKSSEEFGGWYDEAGVQHGQGTNIYYGGR